MVMTREQAKILMKTALEEQQMARMAGAPMPEVDPGKWELETSKLIDTIKNELLGNKLDQNGVWVRDPAKPIRMNEKGANAFVLEVLSRMNVHSQLSELSEKDIVDKATEASENFGYQIEDQWREWDILPTESEIRSICMMLYDLIDIGLKIAKNAGMRRHRERTKNPYANISTEMPQGI